MADLGSGEGGILELQGEARRKAGSCWPRGKGIAAPESPRSSSALRSQPGVGWGMKVKRTITEEAANVDTWGSGWGRKWVQNAWRGGGGAGGR